MAHIISITGDRNDSDLILHSANSTITDLSGSKNSILGDLQRLTMINLQEDPVFYNGLATFKAYSDLYIPSMKLNKASVFSFGTAMGPLRKHLRGIEYNFGPYTLEISSQLTGNYYDILLQESGVTEDSNKLVTGSIVQIYPEGGKGHATFTCGPEPTANPVPVSGYAGWTDTNYIYTCAGETVYNLAAHFCMPWTGEMNVSSNRVSCIVAAKSMKDIAGQLDNFFNVSWLVQADNNHAEYISATMKPILDVFANRSMNITTISGFYHHPNINIETTNTFDVPTKIWIKAGTQTPTRKEILVARSWVNPVNDVEEFIEFMTIVLT